jgi:hypothetical protein
VAPTTTTTRPPTTTTVAPTTTAPNRRAIGTLDGVRVDGRNVTATGWALDLDGGKPLVRLLIDGRVVATTAPDRRRDDVWNYLGRTVDRNSGYAASANTSAGTHTVCTQLRDSNNATGWHTERCAVAIVK